MCNFGCNCVRDFILRNSSGLFRSDAFGVYDLDYFKILYYVHKLLFYGMFERTG